MISVCVLMITYNHEKFIEKSIEGVLNQKFDGLLDLYVADDCSLDSTMNIVKRISENHKKGKYINYIRREENIGIARNLMGLFSGLKHDYIAICDGDDYWINETKLQKQINFLEKNKDYSICSSKAIIFDNERNTRTESQHSKNSITANDLLDLGNMIYSSTVIYRNSGNYDFNKIKSNLLLLDYPLLVYHLQFGKAFILPEVLSQYNKHYRGGWSKSHSLLKKIHFVNSFNSFIIYLRPEYHFKIRAKLNKQLQDIYYSILKNREVEYFKTLNESSRFDLYLDRIKILIKTLKVRHLIHFFTYIVIVRTLVNLGNAKNIES